jgi:hypothetical protein
MRRAQCLIVGFDFAAPMKVLDLLDADAYESDDSDLLNALTYSSLTSAPHDGEGWHRPSYVFTRFLSDCAAAAGFDAIKYPSTRLTAQNGSFNLVVLNQMLTLQANATGVSYLPFPARDPGKG